MAEWLKYPTHDWQIRGKEPTSSCQTLPRIPVEHVLAVGSILIFCVSVIEWFKIIHHHNSTSLKVLPSCLQLKELSVVELKYYLTAHDLPVSGKKEALISRILSHMGK